MASSANLFSSLQQRTYGAPVKVGNGGKLDVKGVGKATLMGTGEVVLQNVLYVPELCANLVSVHKLYKQSYEVQFRENGDYAEVLGPAGTVLARFYATPSGLYVMAENQTEVCAMHVRVMSKHELWHRRLGHVFDAGIKRMQSKVVDGLDLPAEGSPKERPCAVCVMGKQQRK
jgi:hypothetical protein